MVKGTEGAELSLGARIDFELLDSTPERVAGRFYSLSVTVDPQLALYGGDAGEAVLVVVHGRLGKRARVRRERFTRFDLLAQRWRELARRRALHGYVVTFEGG